MKYNKASESETQDDAAESHGTVQMVVLIGDDNVKYELSGNPGRMMIVLEFKAGESMQQLAVKYEVSEQVAPLLNVEPTNVDFGSVDAGKIQNTQLKITNKGIKKLHWKVSLPVQLQNRGQYLSFLNEEIKGKGYYAPSMGLGTLIQFLGAWPEYDGYPIVMNSEIPLMIGFTGSAAILYIEKESNAGVLSLYLDETPLGDIDCRSDKREIIELPVSTVLLEGQHTLKLTVSGGQVALKGMRIRAKEILSGPPGWIKISPDIGDTTSEVDYVNVRIQADRLEPGRYSGTVLVESDGGDIPIEVAINVMASNTAKILMVHYYARGFDFLYTSSPEREDKNVLSYYKRQGIAFRLFKENTPGTRKLFRWYHAGIGDHYYSSEPETAEKSLRGYILEGSIGSIATSKLPGTRELYRWYHPKTGLHVYTLDAKGEGFNKKGYTFDGIVGYVR